MKVSGNNVRSMARDKIGLVMVIDISDLTGKDCQMEKVNIIGKMAAFIKASL